MRFEVHENANSLGRAAAAEGASVIREAIAVQGRANIILATGASQFATLQHLVDEHGIDWARVHCFHLDEYVGISDSHPASFCRYLAERFVQKLPQPVAHFEFINGAADDVWVECERLAGKLNHISIDVAFIGIGENGHIAFNDPPADFETDKPYLIVELDEACRQQQFGEGWFPSLAEVPTSAITMSVHQIMRSKKIVCSVPDERKATAVAAAIQGDLTPQCPASILRTHSAATIHLDHPSAVKLTQ